MSELTVQGNSPEAVCYAVRREVTSGSVAIRDAITVSALCWVEKELSPKALSATYTVPPERIPEKHRRAFRRECRKYVTASVAQHPECMAIGGIILSIKIIFLIIQIVRLIIEWRLSQEGEAYLASKVAQ